MKLRENIETRCKKLKLNGFLVALQNQLSSKAYDTQSFLVRLDHLLLAEETSSINRSINRLQKQARLRWPNAAVAMIDYGYHPGLSPAKIADLAELHWLYNNQHVVICGPTGSGKTYLACCLANQVIMAGYAVLFFRYNELLLQLIAADKGERFTQYCKKLNRAPVVVIDDWGVAPLSASQRHLLFEFIESRDQNASLIITSQYPMSDWHEAFGDPTIADSVLDRIIHNAHHIDRKQGGSIRSKLGVNGGAQ
ncbi:IS21-like element helper ATPase IstB [Rheinheimera texasensis]|uniref:IS21-like element helper ATPase IstB n=1 Tax=Rheinheimera texasensis TaxID=306205 RepID=UPI0032B2DD0F